MEYREFYSELGKLLYAIADIDHVITQKEKRALLEVVKNELVPNERHTDAFGTDVAYYSEMEFEILDDAIADSESAFSSFIDYIEDHHTAFDEKIKKVALFVSKEIAKAFHGTNKKEKELINKLIKSLNKIEFKPVE